MRVLRKFAGLGAAAMIATTSACSSTLGNVLGSVLGGGGGQGQSNQQLQGTIRAVNNREITIQQSNGQSIAVMYDNQTQVVYQNQRYPVNSLEYGDQVTASIRQAQNGYYTDYVQVDRSVTGSASGSSSGVQTFQGTVRQIDSRNGLFSVESGNGILTVSLPYNPRSRDVDRYQRLRQGEFVRFYGVFLNNSRVELREFY